jgi:hypothetical protein
LIRAAASTQPFGARVWVKYNASIMPTVLRDGPYRIYFYSHEPNEPPHVHVDRDSLSAKFWLSPVSLARNLGFGARELRQVERIVRDNQTKLMEAWNGYFRVGG